MGFSAADYDEIAKKLEAIVGQEYVLSAPVDLAVYECDGDTLDAVRPDLVVLPETTDEVQAVMRLAHQFKVPVTPRGAGTGLSGGANPVEGGISLVLTRMNKILEIDPENFTATVQVGVTNQAVSKAAGKWGLYFAPDPSSGMASTIGGNLAENAGGAHTLKYGMTVHHVLGARIVFADGEATTVGGKVRDALGLDLLGVIVGSEGTLAVATEAILRLTPKPKAVETMLAYFPSVEAGGQAVSDVVAAGIIPAAMEMIDKLSLSAVEDALSLGLNREAGALLIVELDGQPASILLEKKVVVELAERHGAFGIKWAENESERTAIWKARKSAFASLGRIAPHAYVLDGVIPRSKLAEAIRKIAQIGERRNLVIANVYHAGDGNLHPAILYHKDDLLEVRRTLTAGKEILDLCLSLGGTLSGEHGIGVEKVMEMPNAFSTKELTAMSYLRQAFDPDGLLNPGKVLPAPKACGESGRRPLLRHQLSALC